MDIIKKVNALGLLDQYTIAKSLGQEDEFCKSYGINIEKAEGSRGGKVVGHTTTGKPIYESSEVEHDHGIKVGHEVKHEGRMKKVTDVRGNILHFGNNDTAHVSKVYKEDGSSYTKSLDIDIEKGGKAAAIGEIREFGGKKYQKGVNGWRPVKKGPGENAVAPSKDLVGKTILIGKNKKKVKVDSFDGTTFHVTDLSGAKDPMTSFGRGVYSTVEVAEDLSDVDTPIANMLKDAKKEKESTEPTKDNPYGSLGGPLSREKLDAMNKEREKTGKEKLYDPNHFKDGLKGKSVEELKKISLDLHSKIKEMGNPGNEGSERKQKRMRLLDQSANVSFELDNAYQRERSQKQPAGTHIGDMSKEQKYAAAAKFGIANPEKLSTKELDKQLVDKNIDAELKKFKENKGEKQKPEKGSKEWKLNNFKRDMSGYSTESLQDIYDKRQNKEYQEQWKKEGMEWSPEQHKIVKDILDKRKNKPKTFEQVLADPEGKQLIEGIEGLDLKREDHKPLYEDYKKQLKQKFGYDYQD